jgi:NADP-dependent 3-hydroxy acid dehydrogenase YdfG
MPRFEPHPSRRAAVVTGASSGIGAATATALAEAGHPVALGARRTDKCEELAAAIRADGGEAVALPLDVGDDDAVKAFAATVSERLGPVEILVSSAGDLDVALVHELGTAEFARQVDVNLVGAHRMVSAFVPGMVARQRGDVVFVSSDVIRAPRPQMGAYVAAKNAVDGMARAMQMELEGTGVRVSVVRPGPTLTGMGMRWDPATLEAVLDEWARWGLVRHMNLLDPADVAAAVTAIVSTPRGAHITLLEIEPEAPIQTGRDAGAQPGGES